MLDSLRLTCLWLVTLFVAPQLVAQTPCALDYPDTLRTFTGCEASLLLSELEDITLNSLQSEGDGLARLNCTTDCAFELRPTSAVPAFLSYEICGTETDCSGQAFCDTIVVAIQERPEARIEPDITTFCQDELDSLRVNYTGNTDKAIFSWFDQANLGGNRVFAGDVFFPSQAGTFSVQITDTTFQSCILDTFNVTVAIAEIPNLLSQDTQTVCLDENFIFTIPDTLSFAVRPQTDVSTNGNQLVFSNIDTTPDSYEVELTNAAGCMDTVLLTLVAEDCSMPVCNDLDIGDTLRINICGGGSYPWNGRLLSQPAIYTDTLLNSAGCDSIAILDLTINDDPVVENVDIMLCGQGDTIRFRDRVFTQPGTFTYEKPDICDTVFNLNIQYVDFTPPVIKTNGYFCDGSSNDLSVEEVYQFYRWNNGNIGPIINISKPGGYSITVISAEGCTAKDSVFLTAAETPFNTVAGDTLLDCNQSPIQLRVGQEPDENEVFTWLNEEGETLANGRDVMVNEPKMFTLFVQDTVTGCSYLRNREIFQDSLNVPVELVGGIISCAQPEVELRTTIEDQAKEDFVRMWTGPEVIGDPTRDTIRTTTPGVYQLRVTNPDNNCSLRNDILIRGDTSLPRLELPANLTLGCGSAVVDIEAVTDSNLLLTYNWNTLDGNILTEDNNRIRVDAAGTYSLEVFEEESGCSSSARTQVTDVGGITSIQLATDNSCGSAAEGRIRITDLQGGTAPYSVSVDGQSYGDVREVGALTSGTHTFSIADNGGCQWDTTIVIGNLPGIGLSLVPELNTRFSDQLVLPLNVSADTNALSFQWSPVANLSCTDCQQPVLSANETETYTVTATNANGCTEQASVRVLVDRESLVYAPSAFSPNGDGNNDVFTLFSDGRINMIKELVVADRYGNILFRRENISTNDLSQGWDGTADAEPVHQGVYLYYAILDLPDGEEVFSGSLTVVR